MKVLILTDHPHLGKGGQTVEVAGGYAKNYLIPQKIVIAATPANIKMWQTKLDKLAKEQVKLKTKMEALAGKISAVKLVIKHKSGEEGKLFGAVTAADIEDAFKAQANLEIDRKKIAIDEPLKHLGTFQVPVKLEADVKAVVNLIIEKADE